MPQHALDVRGSVNTTGVIAGGSTVKQIDCGTNTCSCDGYIAFNFTFNNIPKVIIQGSSNWGTANMVTFNAYSVTISGFYLSSHNIATGNATVGSMGASPMSWIAVG